MQDIRSAGGVQCPRHRTPSRAGPRRGPGDGGWPSLGGQYPVRSWDSVTCSQRGRSAWSGVSCGCGWRCARAACIVLARSRTAVLALARSIGVSVWAHSAAARLASLSAASFPAMSAWPGTHWRAMVMPWSTSASIADQTRSARLSCCASGPRCRSWRPERESEHSMTEWMRLLDSSGSDSRQVKAASIATSSALMLLHTEPAGTSVSTSWFSRCSWISAPPPPSLVPDLAEPSDQMVQSGLTVAMASRAAAFLTAGGSSLLVARGRERGGRRLRLSGWSTAAGPGPVPAAPAGGPPGPSGSQLPGSWGAVSEAGPRQPPPSGVRRRAAGERCPRRGQGSRLRPVSAAGQLESGVRGGVTAAASVRCPPPGSWKAWMAGQAPRGGFGPAVEQ